MAPSANINDNIPEPSGPPAVSRFEFNLLRLLRFLVGQFPLEQTAALLYAKLATPGCVSAICMRLAEDTLAKGCVRYLTRAGGWRREKFLVKNQPKLGRIWDRLPVSERALSFGPTTFSFMMWLTAEKLTDTKENWNPQANTLTPADELFFFMVYDALRGEPEIHAAIADKYVFRRNPLCCLAQPGAMAGNEEFTAPDFAPSTTGTRAAILECLQPVLASRWTQAERNKGSIADWKQMRLQGSAEHAVLQSFLQAVQKAQRPDLARFVLRTASAILNANELAPSFWTGGLQTGAPVRLAERIETQRAALALPRNIGILQEWDRQARTVSYFDEEYPASQLWKEEWEQAQGERIAANARQVVALLDPLRTG